MFRAKDKCFRANRGGTVGPIFGLLAVVLVLVIGVGIDGSRAYKASSHVAMAIDAAAMAAAK